MIIDSYCHILPPKYQEYIDKNITGRDPGLPSAQWSKTVTPLTDLEARFRIMDAFDEYIQVITIASPPCYALAQSSVAIELARIGNDGLAELVQKYPDRFAAGIATVPMNDPDSAVIEAERAVKDLRLRGVELFSDINGLPLDSPEFMPFYEKMAELGRPVFIHPLGGISTPDYEGEEFSKFRLWTKLGWPYATAKALCRLVYGGVMEAVPGLKVVSHHCGGFIPYLAGRLNWADDLNEMLMGKRDIDLKEHALNYFRRQVFYDTAVSGNTAALECARAVIGIDQMVFGSDMPFDNQLGRRLIRQTIESVERMPLSASDKRKIFRDNAIELLRLPLGVM